ncbi:methionine ABC transporter ATP-binding protein [Falsigemmobacter faecalis]|uniref:Cell division ATP-binding protein FtsE n=1 Tax=Falsigemmobacter faecalis TaxID=2488730 RepID=A0A3P3D2E0_9RHOB|nr:ATP-binding cassette domain-containing protein [Falsigemmobacter faecalis]RRH67914.1 ATP-binding cassette domain-containing protein [Falsigemmobacter faecalis]
MISLSAVSRHFGTGPSRVAAVDQVDLNIPGGEIFGVIGYSGAGKSTLIRLLNGLERPTAGRVIVNGTDIGAASERALRQVRPKIGMIFQHFNLLWSRSVRGNIALPMEIAGLPKDEIRRRTEELIGLVGLEGRGDHWPSQLSGGQKQRVGIARALANQPDVLLCDEATSALDPETTDQILDLLAGINRRLGLTIVLITHEMHVVRRICSSVAVMEAGRVIETGPVAQVFTAPREPVTQRFIGQIPAPEPKSLSIRLPDEAAQRLLAIAASPDLGLSLKNLTREGNGFRGEVLIRPLALADGVAQLRAAGIDVSEG